MRRQPTSSQLPWSISCALVALVIFAGCADPAPTGGGGGDADPPGQAGPATFVATSITELGAERPLVPGTELRLIFDRDAITADAGCNQLTGRAGYDGGQLIVSELVTTDMFCGEPAAEQDDWLAGFLTAQPAWERTAAELVLRTDTAEIRLREHR